MPQAPLAPSARRRTQKERRDDTQHRLLEATLDCVVRLGYARTTTTEIVQRAGVSQGALFKHYPTKAALLSAAVAHLFAELVAGYRRDFAGLPADEHLPEAAFDLLWSIFTGPRLIAGFELYIAARTDRELAQQLEPVVRAHRAALLSEARALFPRAASDPVFDGFIELLMCAMEGMVIEGFGAGATGDAALVRLKTLVLAALAGAQPAAVRS